MLEIFSAFLYGSFIYLVYGFIRIRKFVYGKAWLAFLFIKELVLIIIGLKQGNLSMNALIYTEFVDILFLTALWFMLVIPDYKNKEIFETIQQTNLNYVWVTTQLKMTVEDRKKVVDTILKTQNNLNNIDKKNLAALEIYPQKREMILSYILWGQHSQNDLVNNFKDYENVEVDVLLRGSTVVVKEKI